MKKLFTVSGTIFTMLAAALAAAPATPGATSAALKLCEGVTNFTAVPQQTRQAWITGFRAAVTAGDIESQKNLMELLAADKNVSGQVFQMWRDAANALVDDGIAQGKKTKAQKAEQIAGLQEGGSTFGLWATPLVIDGVLALDLLRLQEAVNVMTNVMPQRNLSTEQLIDRDGTVFEFQCKTGDADGRGSAMAALTDRIYNAKPTTEAGELALYAKSAQAVFNALARTWDPRGLYNAAAEICETAPAFLKPALRNAAGYRLGGAWYADRKEYDRLLAGLRRAAFDPGDIEIYDRALSVIARDRNAGPKSIQDLLLPLEAHFGQLGENQRFAVLSALLDSFHLTDDLAKAKEYYAKLIEVRPRSVTHIKWGQAQYLWGKRDFDGSLALMNEVVSEAPGNTVYQLAHARTIMASGNMASMRDKGLFIATNTAFNAETRIQGHILEKLAGVGDAAAVAPGMFSDTRIFSDGLGAEGEDDLAKEIRFFSAVRSAAQLVAEAGMQEDRVGAIKALVELADTVKKPEIKPEYTVRFQAHAPQSAEAAALGGLFDKLPSEKRFGPYASYSSHNRQTELSSLRAAPEIKLDEFKKGHEGAAIFLFDDLGLHIYGRFADPDAGKSLHGFSNGVYIEMNLMPGESGAYHQTLLNSVTGRDVTEVEWSGVTREYKLTRDFVRHDFYTADDCYYTHTVFPWEMFYNKLPANGDIWRLVFCASWGGQFRSLGGSSVHELGRSLRLQCELTEADLAQVKSSLVRTGAGRYKQMRDGWHNADFFDDPHLGDQAYYAAVVKPFLEENDALSARVRTGSALAPEEVDRLFKERLGQWLDFRLTLDAKRVEYLENKFFR